MLPERQLNTLAYNIAKAMEITKGPVPKKLLSNVWDMGWSDPYTNRTQPFIKLIVLQYLRLLASNEGLEHIETRRAYDERIKCIIYEYVFKFGDKEFVASTMGTENFSNQPLMALTDCIFGYEVESGCEGCGFSEEGCERCGFNKARRLINNSPTVKTFRNTGKGFFEALGEERSEHLLRMTRMLNRKVVKVHNEEIGKTEIMEKIHGHMEEGIVLFRKLKEPKNLLISEEVIYEKLKLDDLSDDNEEDEE